MSGPSPDSDHDRAIENLTSGIDLAGDLGRRRGYLRCLEHADRHLRGDPAVYNEFVARAAERLGQVPLFRNVAGTVPQHTGRERLHLTYSRADGPLLTGNREGLAWLAGVLARLAQARIDGEHVRLRAGDGPLFGDSHPLDIWLKDDAWFDHLDTPVAPPPADVPRRDVVVGRICALRLSGEIPPPLLMTSGKVYPVLRVEKLEAQQVWTKEIRPESDRVYVFEFRRDDGAVNRLALDLDDEQVEFLTG